ncbi:MAG: ABC-F family ATP-binding cassette domain-containing protein [Phycisphaeraceae bacterium]|nr:ABC-F family ATP-binding cassette domain-containing protein [Phycisphaerales bacterium]MCB9861395.1 ABC-F family ATP-binding cassette domain-containing protein [Phycisphaeraceae bacterium]
MAVDRSDRIGLIGPNGSGKSTLLKLLADIDHPDDGSLTVQPSARVVYVPQNDQFDAGVSARNILIKSAYAKSDTTHDDFEAELLADMLLSRFGFDSARAMTPADALSGGWRKRLAFARAFSQAGGEPDALLLDEPTNHLDIDSIQWLESFLVQQTGSVRFAIVFVTHDRIFLERVATRVVELSPAYPHSAFTAEGNYTEFLRRKSEFLEGQQRAQQALAGIVRRDLAWLSRGPQGRQTKAKGRISASYARMDELEELKTRNTAASQVGPRVDFDATGRRARKLLTARGISKSLGNRLLFDGVDLTLGAGDRLGLLGANGSGKTTLIRVLTGELLPDAGTVEVCDPAPRILVFSQHREDFPPATLLRHALCPVSDTVRFRGQSMHVISWARRFLFRDEQLDQPVKSLSGGELARIHIARIMLEPADILVLDEPTNDLDIPTLETMEDSLEDFPGALVLVTHDRAMLQRLATSVLALDGMGSASMYASVDQALAAAQRPRQERDEEKRSTATKSDQQSKPVGTKKKLSYMEQREYDSIEQRIEQAEMRVVSAEGKLADPGVMSDHDAMTAVCDELSNAQNEVALLYARWDELEAKQQS